MTSSNTRFGILHSSILSRGNQSDGEDEVDTRVFDEGKCVLLLNCREPRWPSNELTVANSTKFAQKHFPFDKNVTKNVFGCHAESHQVLELKVARV